MRRYKKTKRGKRLYKKIILALAFCIAACGFLSSNLERDDLHEASNITSLFVYETADESLVDEYVYDSSSTISGITESSDTDNTESYTAFDLSILPEEIPEEGYVYINDNIPALTEEEITTIPYEEYGELDELGRCTYAISCIDISLMPTEERGDISSIYPTGWQQEKYDFINNGGYLYNRCHLIGFQLTGENANEKNLITGTRFLNLVMLEFENEVADYIEDGGTVMYRVVPIFEEDNLLATGVTIEALSVSPAENIEGDISFYVFCYNVQEGVTIDYETGANSAA